MQRIRERDENENRLRECAEINPTVIVAESFGKYVVRYGLWPITLSTTQHNRRAVRLSSQIPAAAPLHFDAVGAEPRIFLGQVQVPQSLNSI